MARGMISVSSTNSGKMEASLRRMKTERMISMLNQIGEEGVSALAGATPVDTSGTAQSWYYEITTGATGSSVVWRNSNVTDGEPVAILIQYGHGTGTGGYVAGRDFINPAIQPIFDRFVNDIWKVVTTA